MDYSYSSTKPRQKWNPFQRMIELQFKWCILLAAQIVLLLESLTARQVQSCMIKRGTVSLYIGNMKRYKAVEGQTP